MPHHTALIATIVAGLGLAFLFGTLAHRLRVSPLVGYLVAGIVIGPYTPGFVANQTLAPQLAEIGVILLMFGVGLHFSLKDLLSVRAISIPGAMVQIAAATALGMGFAWLRGWPLGGGLVFGLSLSVASTVVLLRALQDRRIIESDRGRIAVGWLIVEDLAMVMTLVLLPPIAGMLNQGGGLGGGDLRPLLLELAVTLGKVATFILLMLVVGRRLIPWVLHVIAHTGSRELFRLAVLSIALGIAYFSAMLFGVSFALGAFFAGMLLSESELSQRAANETLPLRDAFAVLFFVSVGMLFDPMILVRSPWQVLATLGIIVIGKSVAALLIVLAFRHPMSTALTIAASLAQIGEFSFILAGLGVGLGLLPPEGQALILAGAILSILLNPVLFSLLDRREKAAATKHPAARAEEEALPMVDLTDHVVLVGHGRVGSLVAKELLSRGVALVVIEDQPKRIEPLRAMGVPVIMANGASGAALRAANLTRAGWLIVAIPNGFEAGQITEKARAANPAIRILARAHSDAEVEHLQRYGADFVIMGEREIAQAMVDHMAAG